MAGRRPPRLLWITPGETRDRGDAERLLRFARGLRAAGLAGILVREPELADRQLFDLGLALREVFEPSAGGWLGIHDRAHVALASGADALHLGFRSLPLAEARAVVGPELALGLSTHAEDDPATWLGADYLFHGPLFATPAKPGQREAPTPIGLEGLAHALALRPELREGEAGQVPMLGLGGIDATRARAVLTAGADGVALIGALSKAEDPHASLLALRAATD